MSSMLFFFLTLFDSLTLSHSSYDRGEHPSLAGLGGGVGFVMCETRFFAFDM